MSGKCEGASLGLVVDYGMLCFYQISKKGIKTGGITLMFSFPITLVSMYLKFDILSSIAICCDEIFNVFYFSRAKFNISVDCFFFVVFLLHLNVALPDVSLPRKLLGNG